MFSIRMLCCLRALIKGALGREGAEGGGFRGLITGEGGGVKKVPREDHGVSGWSLNPKTKCWFKAIVYNG
jgi:hypothetical protein